MRAYRESAAIPRLGTHPATQRVDAFPHPDEAETAAGRRVRRTISVIVNGDLQSLQFVLERDRRGRRTGVPADVCERLLDDAVRRLVDVGRQCAWLTGDRYGRRQPD